MRLGRGASVPNQTNIIMKAYDILMAIEQTFDDYTSIFSIDIWQLNEEEDIERQFGLVKYEGDKEFIPGQYITLYDDDPRAALDDNNPMRKIRLQANGTGVTRFGETVFFTLIEP